jgi:hypothetical protein
MLPHVDEFRPVHSLNALTELVETLTRRPRDERATDPRRWMDALPRVPEAA